MRRWFVLTLISGVLVTLAGCGGEVATETADNGGSAAPPASAPPSAPPTGGAASGAPGGGTPTGAPAGGGYRPGGLPGNPVGMSGPGGQSASSGGSSNPVGSGGVPGGNPYAPSGAGGGNPNPYAGGGNPANPMGSGGVPGGNPYAPSGAGGGNPNPYAGGGNPANPMGSGGVVGGNPYAPGGGDPANPMGNSGGNPANPMGNGGGVDPANPMGGGSGAAGATVAPPPGGFPGGGPPGAPTGAPGSNYAGAAGNQQQPATPLTLREKAVAAFQQGRDDDGTQLMYAYMVADPDAEFSFGLLPVANEPRAVIRWGVAIDYSAPGNFSKAPPTIGAQPNVLPQTGGRQGGGRGGPPGGFGGSGAPPIGDPGAGGSGGFGGGAAGGGGASPPSGGYAQLEYYAGELGTKLVDRLNMRRTHEDAFYGEFLKEIAFDPSAQPTGGGSGFAGFQGPVGGPAGGGPSSRGPSGGPPSGGPRGGAGFDPTGAGVGQSGGDFTSPPTGAPGGNPYQPGGASRTSAPRRDANTNQLMPGVVWLGKGRRVELIEEARARGLDGLILIETKISVVPRTGLESNTTKLFVINVSAEETKDQVVYQTRSTLKNVPVWQAIQQGKEHPIEVELDNLFPESADLEFKLGALPTLTPEQAKARVEKIATSSPENALPVLAEIKYFHKESLINDADLMSAYENVLGDAASAKSLASGDSEEREKAIEEWMPGNFEPAGNDDGGRFR